MLRGKHIRYVGLLYALKSNNSQWFEIPPVLLFKSVPDRVGKSFLESVEWDMRSCDSDSDSDNEPRHHLSAVQFHSKLTSSNLLNRLHYKKEHP
jgi:hypothetical protein